MVSLSQSMDEESERPVSLSKGTGLILKDREPLTGWGVTAWGDSINSLGVRLPWFSVLTLPL